MFLGRVAGELVATLRHPALAGQRLLWVERVGPDGRGLGRFTLALDHADAGEGDRVLVLDEGNGAAQVLRRPRGPIRTVIVGIVDAVDAGAASAPDGGTVERTDAWSATDPRRADAPLGDSAGAKP